MDWWEAGVFVCVLCSIRATGVVKMGGFLDKWNGGDEIYGHFAKITLLKRR